MALHAEPLHLKDELPKFASTSVSAHFIRNCLLLAAKDREHVLLSLLFCWHHQLLNWGSR